MRILITNIHRLLGIQDSETLSLRGEAVRTVNSIDSAWLLIEDGLIADFGTGRPELDAEQVIDAKAGLLYPAYSDSHTHLVFAATREQEFQDRIAGLSYEEIAARGGGILNSVEKLRGMSEDELYTQSLERAHQVMRSGTASIEIKSGYGLDLDNELKMLRVARRIADSTPLQVKTTLLAAHAFPVEYRDDPAGYVDYICREIIPAAAAEGLADYIDAFCERGYFDAQQTRQIIEVGQQHGMRAKVHVNQFSSCGGVEAALEYGALSVDHLEVMEEHEFDLLAQSDTFCTGLPACSYFLSIPYTPLNRLVDSGALIALASDYNPGSSPTGDMNFVLSAACIKMNLHPYAALNACTLNGAAAMELSASTGSITRGKRADLILSKPMKDFALIPYDFASDNIHEVWVNGSAQRVNSPA